MSHFAQVIDGIVKQVIVVEQDVLDTGIFGDPAQWIQTSYNTRGGVHYGPDGQPDGGVALRKNYAGIGYHYDSEADAFYAAQPFPSWTLDTETYFWNPPVPYPVGVKTYRWDEDQLDWIELS